MDLLKEISVQTADCSACPDTSPGAKANICRTCTWVEDLLRQVAKLQETVKKVCSIRDTDRDTVL